ncbi:unnamed protein product [Rotaria magnacalcarata]|uniref:RRM domain-containing protein n=3 Tax=Rotaria magnacalcarata TaxID=392030 RepID=A0A819NF18_9BILA|nr:unnamed protein product [Rotaria magnacalcarata]CAF2121930.1 unnamed protein product [Rotaria magnacalcarata]CAF3993798.1 unnamed protein product [Rotaria magnacalcarata]CAF4050238.1 unnamed protein product [Rotaria magnacalcarata]
MNISTCNTIYVGNIQSIDDNTLREYFQRFGEIEALFHNCSRAVDEWLIDYRFIRFSSNTDISMFLTNKVDHTIGRIRLDIHTYDVAFNDETRLLLDRKICIAHTNPKLDRNIIKKAFTRYGRILNCTCASSGNGVEYVYIEFDSINSVRSVLSSSQNHSAGRTSLAVRQALRPSQIGVKVENNNMKSFKYSYPEPRSDTGRQFSSNAHSSMTSTPPVQCLKVSQNENSLESNTLATSPQSSSQQQLKDLEEECGLIIRKDFDEITYQIEKYLQKQQQTYKKLR